MFLTSKSFAAPQRGAALLLAATFAAGLSAGALVAPMGNARVTQDVPLPRVTPRPAALTGSGHPAAVLRVIDGDTFEARVRVWPGMDIMTKVRLRGIDAPELHARCEDERVKALAAREALVRLLAQGGVGIARIGQDKYGGRVDADVSTVETPDVSAAMLEGGFARRYDGGRRAGWCG